jgi:hypothetical protein
MGDSEVQYAEVFEPVKARPGKILDPQADTRSLLARKPFAGAKYKL